MSGYVTGAMFGYVHQRPVSATWPQREVALALVSAIAQRIRHPAILGTLQLGTVRPTKSPGIQPVNWRRWKANANRTRARCFI